MTPLPHRLLPVPGLVASVKKVRAEAATPAGRTAIIARLLGYPAPSNAPEHPSPGADETAETATEPSS